MFEWMLSLATEAQFEAFIDFVNGQRTCSMLMAIAFTYEGQTDSGDLCVWLQYPSGTFVQVEVDPSGSVRTAAAVGTG